MADFTREEIEEKLEEYRELIAAREEEDEFVDGPDEGGVEDEDTPDEESAEEKAEGEEENPETWTLPAEFNDRPHITGTLSMARSPGRPNSAGSQFFICVGPTPQLDNKYTVFGQVVEGLDVIQKIVNTPRDRRDNPKEKVEMTVKIIPRSEALDS